MVLAFCWAHWRRRFYEIAKGGGAPIAQEALRRIAGLYKIEAQIRGTSAEARRAVRQATSKSIVEDLKSWLEAQLARASAKSAIAVAIRYGFNHWEGLSCFLEDGRIEIDSNIVERSMRPIALNLPATAGWSVSCNEITGVQVTFGSGDSGAVLDLVPLGTKISKSTCSRISHEAGGAVFRLASGQ